MSDTIGLIYDAVTSESGWFPAMERLRTVFNGSRACVTLWTGPDVRFAATGGDPAPPNTAEMFEEAQSVGFEDAFGRLPLASVYNVHQLVEKQRYRQTSFWNDWARPLDMYGGIGVKLNTGFFDLQRGRRQEAFDRVELNLLERFAPHFARAEELSRRLAVADAFKAAATLHEVAAVIVDGQLRIDGRNEAAEALMAENGLVGVRDGIFHINSQREDARLKRLTADACRVNDGVLAGTGGDILVSGRSGLDSGGLIVSVTPTRVPGSLRLAQDPRAVVAMRRIEPGIAYNSELFLRSSFGLTPAESRLCVALLAGRSLSEASVDLGLRVSTLRSYLEQIFRKTGTRRQAQLVALLKSAEPPLRR